MAFGIAADGTLVMRSKGKELFADNPEKLFTVAIEWITKNQETNLIADHARVTEIAQSLDLETVPLLAQTTIRSFEELQQYMQQDSVLGGTVLEGVVVKNYRQYCLISDFHWISMGKFVREIKRGFPEWYKEWLAKKGFAATTFAATTD